MSLSSLNSPALTSLAGITLHLVTPKLEQLALDPNLTSLSTLQWANAISYAVQFIAVSIPGRIDGEVAKQMEAEDNEMEGKKNYEKLTESTNKDESGKEYTNIGGRTLVSPAGWAFAIWGPIFLGELVFVSSQFRISNEDSIAPLLREISVPFTLAQTFQSLWCATFRPKYKKYNSFISAGFLTSVAYSLSKAHKIYSTSSPSSYSNLDYLTMFLPMGMHFGWTTAASLVNLNGSISSSEFDLSSAKIALVGHASAIGACILGVAVTLSRSAPVYGSVIAWALKACAAGMKKRLEKTVMKEGDGEYDGVKTQWWLCTIGAIANIGTALLVAGRQKSLF
mmetsp:Transcript_66613/g.98780  ORF Transcript_66613/g.98780 Transcript_66613/m.98780 type:complete len:338 (-) Transcript_66613:363-1376(-)